MQNTVDPSPDSCFHPDNYHEELVFTLNDMFLAGTETTSSTLTWAILLMIRKPKVQEQVRIP